MTEQGTWLELDQPEDEKKMPKWKRRSLCFDDGRVFLPAGVFDNESAAMLSLSFDGHDVAHLDGHIYAPSEWLANEYPEHRDAILEIASAHRSSLKGFA